MQYHSLFEPYQLPHGEWTSLHLTWLRMPIARSSKYSPWRLVCSHHIHDGGLRAQHKAYGEYRLSQQTHHIRELDRHNFVCDTPPCSCKVADVDPHDRRGDIHGKNDTPQWGDIGRGSTSRRRDRKRPPHATRAYCSNPKQSSSTEPRTIDPDFIYPGFGHTPRPQSRAPPPQPPIQTPTARQLAEAWSHYQERCHAMCTLPRETNPRKRYLTFSSIPWPVFGTVTRLSDLRLEAIREFLCPPGLGYNERRARVKSALLVFHPDRSAARWMTCLHSDDIPAAQTALNVVTQNLTLILQSL